MTPCPTCECGCGGVPGLYPMTNKRDGAVKGQHKRFVDGHGNRKPGSRVPESTEDENERLLANLLREALVSGATGDDLVKVFLDSHELATAIVMAQVVKALAGNVQSANWLFARGIGTATKKGSNASEKLDLAGIFGNPLDSEDDLFDE